MNGARPVVGQVIAARRARPRPVSRRRETGFAAATGRTSTVDTPAGRLGDTVDALRGLAVDRATEVVDRLEPSIDAKAVAKLERPTFDFT